MLDSLTIFETLKLKVILSKFLITILLLVTIYQLQLPNDN